jgi:nicotinate phosphoribosyltransferase
VATAEVLRPDGADTTEGRPLQVPLVRAGEPVVDATWQQARTHHRAVIAELPAEARGASDGDPAMPTIVRPGDGQDRYITAPTEEVAR